MDKANMVLMEQIKAVLEKKELKYEDDGEEIIGIGFRRFNCLYHVREDSLDFRLLIKEEVPEKYTDEMFKFLNHINCITKDGHWELISGHVQYRLYTDRTYDKEVPDSRIENVLDKGCLAADLFYTGIDLICEGIVSAEDAFEKLVMKRLKEEE